MRAGMATERITEASRRILVAEDDAVTMRLITAILEKEGYAVVPACDGKEAYRILHTDAGFMAAIFDINMPHLGGLEVVRYMGTERRLMRIPVMMMTAERDPTLGAESFAAGALFFLPKPFSAEQLVATLRMLIGKASAVMTIPAAN
ncbi:MAG: response regulator [Acidobacteriota bacterium]|nr:response regulator [Acidobacteriota bacterium]